jgi:hypothetical protein
VSHTIPIRLFSIKRLEVFNKEEALGYFKSSDYKDCRINAYPPYTEYHGINRTPISFLMVDLDLKDFGDQKNAKFATINVQTQQKI